MSKIERRRAIDRSIFRGAQERWWSARFQEARRKLDDLEWNRAPSTEVEAARSQVAEAKRVLTRLSSEPI